MKNLITACVLSFTITGCASADRDPDVALSEVTEELSCPVPKIDPARSLMVTDPTALANFSFQRVMGQVVRSANVSNTPLAMYQDWMATFANCNDPTIDPNGYGIVCPRVESGLGSFNPFLSSGPHFIPVAIANRFDLTPRGGADCGEYRIVYAMVNGNGRAFIIFEARLPNPTPDAGVAGCAPVADFWAQLSTDPRPASRARKLDNFFFSGLPGFEPVVAASHYGLPQTNGARGKGQIRTNFFFQFAQWQLREFQLRRTCSYGACTLAVAHVTVKANPANELFDGTHPNAARFQPAFLTQIPALSRRSAATIAMTNGDNFNEFESVSQGSSDTLYQTFTEPRFRDAIKASITHRSLTVDNILDRATTQTCAGCHLLSTFPPHNQLGDGVVFPSSLGFVHIDENSNLSQALTESFLPHRKAVLAAFLASQCTGISTATDGDNLGGGPLDAAN